MHVSIRCYGRQRDWFHVRQGCVLSPELFQGGIDCIMNKATIDRQGLLVCDSPHGYKLLTVQMIVAYLVMQYVGSYQFKF